jgi:hypothetical protein
MKTSLVILLLGVGLLAATGCQNFEHRVKQKAALVATLDEATHARLRAGEIRIGDSEDLVYLARGKPDEKKLTTTARGETTTWVYNRYSIFCSSFSFGLFPSVKSWYCWLC